MERSVRATPAGKRAVCRRRAAYHAAGVRRQTCSPGRGGEAGNWAPRCVSALLIGRMACAHGGGGGRVPSLKVCW